jgi:regulator of sigma E protease
MLDLLRSAAAFIVVLGVLVFVHEFGHYIAARWRGVHVEVFSIGFGPAIATWRDRVGTVWKLAWLPLGGYVKLHGQERAEDVSDDVRATWMPGRLFHEKRVGSRAIVVAAGPIANFLLAIVLFAALFATAGKPTILPVAGGVLPDSAAAHAGLQVNDRIIAIDGKPTSSFGDIQTIVSAHPSEKLALTVRRGDTTLTLPVVTDSHMSGDTKVGMLGISGGQIEYTRLSMPAALVGGITQTWDITRETIVGVWQMISGQRGTEDLGGPLRIAQLSGAVAEQGPLYLIQFIALLSVNLGLLNLFPIPVLDGGHLLFYLAEALRGRPIPARVQEYGFRAGLALLLGLFILATWNDLTRPGVFH